MPKLFNELMQEEHASIERARVIVTLSHSIVKAMETGELKKRINLVKYSDEVGYFITLALFY